MLSLILLLQPALAVEEREVSCSVYFTGVGCPHCAKTDPFIFKEFLQTHPNLVVIEYEIYREQENAVLLQEYDAEYISGFGIPKMIFGKGNLLSGDITIVSGLEGAAEAGPNPCPLPGKREFIGEIDIQSLSGKPGIWRNERVLLPKTGQGDGNALMEVLLAEDVAEALEGKGYRTAEPRPVEYSGGKMEFGNAVELGGWLVQWNGEPAKEREEETPLPVKGDEEKAGSGEKEQLALPKLVSLAVVDAVNPCAIAVLTLMLIAIMTYNPREKKRILFAGGAFCLAVFLMYFIYGLIIIRFFQLVQALTSIRLAMYAVLGAAAIILGLLNIKDFFSYKPGGIGTEMPMFLRPKVKKVIGGITSPRGAFTVGLFVTFFLLPCTIGPYVIAGGILSVMEIMQAVPFLFAYNVIFVLPMVAITLAIYFGMAKVDDVSGWKDRNIKYLHLAAGAIMILLGIAMVMGWI